APPPGAAVAGGLQNDRVIHTPPPPGSAPVVMVTGGGGGAPAWPVVRGAAAFPPAITRGRPIATPAIAAPQATPLTTLSWRTRLMGSFPRELHSREDPTYTQLSLMAGAVALMAPEVKAPVRVPAIPTPRSTKPARRMLLVRPAGAGGGSARVNDM